MLVALTTITILFILRIYFVLPRRRPRPSKTRGKDDKCSFAVFLGSGGHTAEALTLVSALDFQRYTPRTYFVSEGDILSARKAADLENFKCASEGQYRIIVIPRARRVHQHLLTTPPTAVLSFLSSVYYVTIQPFILRKAAPADLLLLNGPGTCVMMCIAVYVNKFFSLPAPKVIYVESFARVKRLSLSGWLLRPLADRFLVQWPQLIRDRVREEYYGRLI